MKFNTTDPATGELLDEYDIVTSKQAKDSIRNAKKAFEDWQRVSYSERAPFLTKLSKILSERKHEFALSSKRLTHK